MAGETIARLDSMAAQNEAFFEEENINGAETSNTEKRKMARSTAFGHVSVPKSDIIYEESTVYRRIMEDLEDEKASPSWYTELFVELVIVVILGPMAAAVATLDFWRIRHLRFILRLWEGQWVMRVMLLVLGLSAVRIATFLSLAPVKWRWRTHKYVLYFVEEIKPCLGVTLWLGLGLVAWYLWFKPWLTEVGGFVLNILAYHISRLLIALVVGSFLWLLKNLLYLKLKADWHYDRLFPKIRRTVIDFHCLQIIYNDGRWKFLNSEKNKRKMNERHVEGKNIWMDVAMMNKQTVPIWITRQLAHNYLQKLWQLPEFWDATKDDQKLLKEAQKLLRRVTRGDECRDILLDDLRKYELDKDELELLFGILDEDEEKEERKEEWQPAKTITKEEWQPAKTITKDQFLSWAAVAYKNCRGLQLTLLSSEGIFIKLNRIMNRFLLTVVLIIWLLLSKILDTAKLALLFSPFFAASFIFGDSCKKMFEGLIFVFFVHPFDVGDHVVVDNIHMKVSEMNIKTSVFHIKYDTGDEKVMFPNWLLARTKIVNLGISPDDQADCLEFNIPSRTPSEDITDLELKIKMALDDGLTYSSQTQVVKKEFWKEEIKMAVYFKYLVPHLFAETKAMHRSRILSKIRDFTKEIDVNYRRWLSVDDNHEVVPVEFTLDTKLTMTLHEINVLKEKLLEAFKEQYIKLLLKGLYKEEIKLVWYLSYPKAYLSENYYKDRVKREVYGKIRKFTDQLNIQLQHIACPLLFSGSFTGLDE